jgi:hypothetical protein
MPIIIRFAPKQMMKRYDDNDEDATVTFSDSNSDSGLNRSHVKNDSDRCRIVWTNPW